MTIKGIEGLSPAEVRAEVERGGSFVIYSYCVSILVMTIKRPSDIIFVPPGKSPVVAGLPYTVLSFLLGWWGIPWGIFYTFEVLIKNLGGGTDVTHAVLAQIDPLPAPNVVPDLPGIAAPPPAQSHPTPARPLPPQRTSPWHVGALRLAALVGILGSIVWTGWSYYLGQNLPVALANGLNAPYELEIDGTSHHLRPGHPMLVTLTEGEHTYVAHFPGGDNESGTFEISTPFSARPIHPQVGLFNADRLGVFYREHTEYRANPNPSAEPPPGDFYFGQTFQLTSNPDYFCETFPDSLSLPNSTSIVRKNRIDQATGATQAQLLAFVENQQGHAARVDRLMRLGALFPDDEEVLLEAYQKLTSPEGEAFFATHLDDVPVHLEWHRYYQFFARLHHLRPDLPSDYLARVKLHPEEGALHYLAGRQLTDAPERIAYYQQAIESPNPCYYGYFGLAAEAEAQTDYAQALTLTEKAKAHGLQSAALRLTHFEMLLANGRIDEALTETIAERAQSDSYELFEQHLRLVAQTNPNDSGAPARIIDDYLASLSKDWSEESRQNFREHCLGIAAAVRGDLLQFTNRMTAGQSPTGRCWAALCTGDHAAAVAIMQEIGPVDTRSWLIAYVSAQRAGDAAAAETYFQHALNTLDAEGPDHAQLAASLRAGSPPDPAEIIQLNGYVSQKQIFVTAFGLRFPDLKPQLFAWADQNDFVPGFPSILLKTVRHSTPRTPIDT